MNHQITINGIAWRLRPIATQDAEFVLALRNNPSLNRFLHSTSSRVEDQVSWLENYFQREDDYYFVVENIRTGLPEGLVAIYDLNRKSGVAEWGRWILRPGSLAAVECAWLVYRCAFEILSLEEVFCRTVADNEAVVSFHDSCGIKNKATLAKHFSFGGRVFDAVEHRMTSKNWTLLEPRLSLLAQRTARRVLLD